MNLNVAMLSFLIAINAAVLIYDVVRGRWDEATTHAQLVAAWVTAFFWHRAYTRRVAS